MYSVINVINTYAWIQATADSKIVSIIGIMNMIIEEIKFVDIIAFPNSDINKCPAIIFAVSRTHKVIGRIMFLVSSMITMNLISAIGVPCGRRWDSMCFVFFIHPNIIIDNHIINDIGKVMERWEVLENTWGYKAMKFIIKISIKTLMIIGCTLFSVLFKVNFVSFLKVSIIFLMFFVIGFLIFITLFLFIIGTISTINQFIENMADLGSNTENRLVII